MPERLNPTIDAVIRIPDVAVARTALETTIGPLDRFEASTTGGLTYAQINAPTECGWSDVLALVQRTGPTLSEYTACGAVGRPILDIAFFLREDCASAALRVPNAVLGALGHFGFDLETTVYLASDCLPLPTLS